MRKNYFLLFILLICKPSFAQVVPSGLISYYHFESSDQKGDSILDKSENHNNAVVVNGTTFTADRVGKSDGAILLGGKDNHDNYLTINSGHDRPTINNLNNYTVSFWYRRESFESKGKSPILTIKDNEGVNYLLEMTSDTVQWSHYNGSAQSMKVLAFTELKEKEWYNIAFTIDAEKGEAILYINGQYHGMANGTIKKLLNPSFTLAANPGVSLSGSPAGFDELYIYDRVINSVEINKVKNNCTVLPETPVVGDVYLCGQGTVTISGDVELLWYQGQIESTPFYKGKSITPTLNSTKTYFVSAISAEGCESASRWPVMAMVYPVPEAPNAMNGFICGPGSVTLKAKGDWGTYQWYDSPTETSPIAVGESFITPNLQATTDFFVSIISTVGCESALRTKVTAVVKDIPEPPIAEDVSTCSPGEVVLSATGSSGAYIWYNSISSSTPINFGSNYVIPDLHATTEFFVSSSMNGCESNRTSVKAIVKPIGDIIPPNEEFIICGPGAVTFVLTGDFDYLWYSEDGKLVGTGKTFTTPILVTNTKYNVEVLHGFQCLGKVVGTAEVKVALLPEFEIVGDNAVEPNSVHVYSTNALGFPFTWSVEGGIGKSDSSSIEITWLEAGTGKVSLTAFNPVGCFVTKELNITKGAVIAGIHTFDAIVNDSKIYPNPSEGKFTIACPLPVEEVVLTNVLGQKQRFYSENIESDFRGMVFAEIKTSQGTFVKKIELK